MHADTGARLCHWQSTSNTFLHKQNNVEADAEKKRQEDAEYEALAMAWLSLGRQSAPPRKSPPGSPSVMNNGDRGEKSSTNSQKLDENATTAGARLDDPGEGMGISSNDKLPKESFMNLMTTLNETPKVLNMVQELVSTLDQRLQASALRVYKFFPNITEDILQIIFKRQELDNAYIAIRKAGHRSCKFVCEVATTGVCRRLSRNQDNKKNLANTRELFKIFGIEDLKVVKHVLYVPLFNDEGVATFVIEIWRASCFSKDEELISADIAKWGSIAIHYYSTTVAS